jgi:hypothetical protein
LRARICSTHTKPLLLNGIHLKENERILITTLTLALVSLAAFLAWLVLVVQPEPLPAQQPQLEETPPQTQETPILVAEPLITPLALRSEIKQMRKKIQRLTPKILPYTSTLLRSWYASGETGKLKVACFAETTNQDLGQLTLTADALRDLTQVFTQMPRIELTEKLAILKKVYWDLLSVINLGPESLEPTHPYFEKFNIKMTQELLMTHHKKLQAQVILQIPEDARRAHIKSLHLDAKIDLFRGVFELSPEIPIELGLFPLLESMSQIEQIQILPELPEELTDSVKRRTPSLAFLSTWQEGPLSRLLQQTSGDELTVYCGLRPELKDLLLELAPSKWSRQLQQKQPNSPGTAATLSFVQKAKIIGQMHTRLEHLVASKAIDFPNIFHESGMHNHLPRSKKRKKLQFLPIYIFK